MNKIVLKRGGLIMKKIAKVIAGISFIGAVIGGILLFLENRRRNNQID